MGVMRDDRCGRARTGDDGVERLMAAFEPFIEDFGLEQRSREVCQQKSRIGFARKEPPPHEGDEVGFRAAKAGRKARNLPAHLAGGRDVLELQRTNSVHPLVRRTEDY